MLDSECTIDDLREDGAYFCSCWAGHQDNTFAAQLKNKSSRLGGGNHVFGVFTEAKQQRIDDLPKHFHKHGADAISNNNDEDESEHWK